MKRRKSIFIKLTILILSVFFLNTTFAQDSGGAAPAAHLYFEETFFPVYVSKNDAWNDAGGSLSSSAPTESGLGYDARTTLGYVWSNILFGLTYDMYSLKVSRPGSAPLEAVERKTSKSEFGPTLGYFLGNWRFAFTYFMSASKTFSQKLKDATTGAVSTDETYKNSGGQGFQFAVGYDFHLGAGFGISPTLIYRTIAYSKQSYTVATGSNPSYASSALQTKALGNDLKPMITLSYSY